MISCKKSDGILDMPLPGASGAGRGLEMFLKLVPEAMRRQSSKGVLHRALF